MSRLDLDAIRIPIAPACPSWCEGHDAPAGNGWDDISEAEVSKSCELRVPAASGVADDADHVVLQRYVWLDWEPSAPDDVIVHDEQPLIRLNTWQELTPDQAKQVAAQLLEAARLAR